MLLTLISLSLLASAPAAGHLSLRQRKDGLRLRLPGELDEVRCASTPYGTCAMFGGAGVLRRPVAREHPPPTGRGAASPSARRCEDEVACGFNCLRDEGEGGLCEDAVRRVPGALRRADVLGPAGGHRPRVRRGDSEAHVPHGLDGDCMRLRLQGEPGGGEVREDAARPVREGRLPARVLRPAHAAAVRAHGPPDPEEVRKPKCEAEGDASRPSGRRRARTRRRTGCSNAARTGAPAGRGTRSTSPHAQEVASFSLASTRL